jgi:trans-aconitate methyltransferase
MDNPWTVDYLDEKFSSPDPWKYLTSEFEQRKYRRQADVIEDRLPHPRRILEIGSAEGAQTAILMDRFNEAHVTCIDISGQAMARARKMLLPWDDRVTLMVGDIAVCVEDLEEGYDVCIWSEAIYYLGAQASLNKTYQVIGQVVNKIRPGGLLVSANTIDLPQDIPEAEITARPLINCYYTLLSSLAYPASRSIYVDEKAGRIYEYQVWAFIL